MPAEESTAFHQSEDGVTSYIVGDSPDDDVIASSSDQSEATEPTVSDRQNKIVEETGHSVYSSTAPSEPVTATGHDFRSETNNRQNGSGGGKDADADDEENALRGERDKQSPAKISRINFQEDVHVVVTSDDALGVDEGADSGEVDEDLVEEAIGVVQRPNGGYGWIVMMASFFSHAFGGGILYR